MKRKADLLSALVSSSLGIPYRGVKRARRSYRKKKRSGVSALARLPKISKDPFPREFRTKLTWNADVGYLAPGASSTYTIIQLNSLYDPDNTNNLGNFQPLMFDQLLSATGPYQKFRVNGWKGKCTIINASANDGTVAIPIDVYYKQGAISNTDVDTWAEVQSQPGVQTMIVGPPGSDSSTKTFYFNGKLTDYIPATADAEDFVGTYSSNPTVPIYGAVAIKNAKGGSVTSVTAFVKVSVEFDVTVYAQDAIQS